MINHLNTAWNYVSETVSQIPFEKAKEFVSEHLAIAAEKISKASIPAKEFIGDYIKEGTKIGHAYNTTTEFVKTHASHIGFAGAVIGGTVLVDSTINLLQKKSTDSGNEVSKILASSGLIALSVAYAANNNIDRLILINVALGAGLADAIVRAAVAVKPTFLVFQLKSKENQDALQEVVYMPNKFDTLIKSENK